MTLRPPLRDAALRWIADDPDPGTRAELQRVLAAAMVGDAAALADLADRMRGPLRFGTAGLRGPVRAGPLGMNVAVVRRTTAGLAGWLAARVNNLGSTAGPGETSGPGSGGLVVVGRDARHGSAAFAAAAAEVLAGAGFDAAVLPDPLPTPVLAFAVQHLGAVAGVQITASHNPPADNGYKVYLGAAVAVGGGAPGPVGGGAPVAVGGGAPVPVGGGAPVAVGGGASGPTGGAQLGTPADVEIEAMIAAAPPAADVVTAPGVRTVDVTQAYLDRVGRLPRGTARALRVALTPLHGVGGATAVHALHRAGFTDVHVVAAQAAADPDFPTVAFPNPEEPGATDALLTLAEQVHADLAVALDPDADRCALGVPLPGGGGWRMLTGDETGVLLGDHVLRSGGPGGVPHGDPLVATTVVSSQLLRAVAREYGVRYAETLTGFKWIVRAGPGLVFGYEEALGYCVDPDAVRDKDGIAAAVLACDLAAGLRAGGASLLDRLDELAVRHGVHRTEGLSVRLEGASRAGRVVDGSAAGDVRAEVVARLAADPPPGWTVEQPAPDVLVLRRGFGEVQERLVVRPSGTEPKLKAYLEVVLAPDPDLTGARARADTRLAGLRDMVPVLMSPTGT